MEAEYDALAEEYDATRESATQKEIDSLARSFEGCRTILDVGVGTGRFAKPLSDLGFDVTGVDVSRRMLSKAHEKGVERLVLGDAYKLPFTGKSFDGSVIIHVLHVVADWMTVMREMGRVTKGPVVSLLRVPQGQGRSPLPQQSIGIAGPPPASKGYPVRTQHRMWQNELELKSRVPPAKLERIRDETISIPVADAMRSLQAKRSMGAQIMPPEVRQEMLERIVAMTGTRTVQRRIVEDLAVWRADDLTDLAE